MTQEEFRLVCARFATGIAVLTVSDALGNPHGLTINSFTSVSLDPPLALVCIDNSCTLLQLFEAASHFGLSFLAEGQQEISNRFAFLPERRFDGVAWTAGQSGVPRVDGSLGWMECLIRNRIEAGDHRIMIGEVVGAQISTESDAAPLIYFGSTYRQLAR